MGLFLDSGAFSAFTKGVKIDIDEYIDFIKKYIDYIEVYANLDVIGDAEKTYENQKYMESKGLTPLPIYHITSDHKWLKLYVENYEYMAIGGIASGLLKGSSLLQELDYLFSEFICDKNTKLPKIKTHAFGVTAIPLMRRYPWYSVDSTSWVMCSRTGGIYIPRKINNEYDYSSRPYVVSFSNRSKTPDKYNYLYGAGDRFKEYVDEYLKFKNFKVGKSSFSPAGEEIIEEEGLSNNYKLRDVANIIYFQDLQASFPEYPIPFFNEPKQLGFL